MGHFYNPPQPPFQGPVNSTPPIPHVLASTGGDQPPRRHVATVLMMVAVLASWPADLEPRLTKPNNQRVQNAATIPPPPVQNPAYTRPRFDIYALNQDAYEVTLVQSFVVAQDSVDQPPRQFALSRPHRALINQSWQPELLTPQGPPETAAWNVTLVTGYVPPRRFPDAIYCANREPDPPPVQRLRSIVPTFATVSQPPVQAGLSVTELVQINASWQQSWDAQTHADTAAWNIPSVAIVAHTPPPALIWTAWEPPPPLPVRPVQMAALTLAYGVNPIPQAALSAIELVQIHATWQQTWGTQTAPESAAWNVPPAAAPPHVNLPQTIWTAWEPPFVAPPKPVNVAPLSLVYGQQPPRSAPIRPANQLAIWTSWPPEQWAAQYVKPSISFTILPPAITVTADYVVRIPVDDTVVRIPVDDEDVKT